MIMKTIDYFYLANTAINPFAYCTKNLESLRSFLLHLRAYVHPNAYARLESEVKVIKVPDSFYYAPVVMRLNEIQKALEPHGLIIRETYEVVNREPHDVDSHAHLERLTPSYKGLYDTEDWKDWEAVYNSSEEREFLSYDIPVTDVKVALVYTATGDVYTSLARAMKESAEKFFCKDVTMHVFQTERTEHLPWPLPALLKWDRLLKMLPMLEEGKYTHVFMIDADMKFVAEVPFSDVRHALNIVHHGSIWGKAKPEAYPNNVDQKLCQYMTSAFVGGQIAPMSVLARKCSEEVEEALLRNCILPYHDETALNTVLGQMAFHSPWEFMHRVNVLPEAYCYFQTGAKLYGSEYEKTCGPAKIMTIDKSELLGEIGTGALCRWHCYHEAE